MVSLKLFVQERCAKCPQAKQVAAGLKSQGYSVIEYDVATADGLAEASFYSVQATPTFILEEDDETMLAEFRGAVPTAEALRDIMGAV
jgi:protein-disulfide isomerase